MGKEFKGLSYSHDRHGDLYKPLGRLLTHTNLTKYLSLS